jgi:RNA polymerase sigma-70 factor, ECF subfamily
LRPEEAQLIARYLAGHVETIREVDGWLQQAAWPFRQRLSQSWDDTLQDVRLEVTRLLRDGKFRGESSLKTYLWRVTSNACVDRVRGQRRVQWEDLDVVDQVSDVPRREAQEQRESGEARDLLVRVLAEMSADCVEMWKMILQGLSYRQMSDSLGVSEGALRVRVLRCRRKAIAVRDGLLGRPLSPDGNTEN